MDKVFSTNYLDSTSKISNFLSSHRNNNDNKTEILARTVKLSEEVGELSEAVLTFIGDQRKEKLDKFKKEHLESEIADVIITATMIAMSTDVDIDRAIKNKLDKINNRLKISK